MTLLHKFKAASAGRGIAFVGSAVTQNGATGATLVINKPAAVLDGDLLISFVTSSSASDSTWSDVTGWTEIADEDQGLSGAPDCSIRVAWKIASSEPSSYTFTRGSAIATLAGFVLAYRNAKIGSAGLAVRAASAGNTVLPETYVEAANSVLLSLFACTAASVTYPAPGSASALLSNSDATAPSWAVFSESVGTGLTGTRASDPSGATGDSCGMVLAIYPSTYTPSTITYVNDTSNEQSATGSANSITVNKPAGVVDGDIMISVVASTSNNSTWTGPAGWTELVDAGAVPNMRVAYKVASGEGASYTFTGSDATGRASAIIVAYRNADYSASGAVVTAASGAIVNAQSIAPQTANPLLLAIYACSSQETFTTPSGMASLILEGSFSPRIAVFTQSPGSVSFTGLRASDPSGTSSTQGILLSLKPR